jgi:hypothetical protein
MAFYRVHSPRPVLVRDLVRMAAQQWKVKESFQTGKELASTRPPAADQSNTAAPGPKGPRRPCVLTGGCRRLPWVPDDTRRLRGWLPQTLPEVGASPLSAPSKATGSGGIA